MRIAVALVASLLTCSPAFSQGAGVSAESEALPLAVAQARSLSYTVRVDSYDPKTRSMSVTFLESSQVMPGVFVDAGSQGRIGIGSTARIPPTLKAGDVVRVNEELKDGTQSIKSIVLVKKSK